MSELYKLIDAQKSDIQAKLKKEEALNESIHHKEKKIAELMKLLETQGEELVKEKEAVASLMEKRE